MLIGQFEEDPAYAQSIVAAVAALSSYDGHSGGSMICAIEHLSELLRCKNLSPLTDDPEEWFQVGPGMWQNTRSSDAFSSDSGRTYYRVGGSSDDRMPRPTTTRRQPVQEQLPTVPPQLP
jgi:hypothetical protein